MVYQTVSIENVISKIIRETKVQDTSSIMELYEVIPDAIGMMQTRFQTHQTYADIQISFHKAKLPCGLLILPAVEYANRRLPWANNSRYPAPKMPYPTGSPQPGQNFVGPYPDAYAPSAQDPPSGLSVMQGNIVTSVNPVTGTNFITYTIDQIMNLVQHPHEYYWTEMGYINTSFPDGLIRLHYKKAPKDENGNLLIPDNSFYREALYYYGRAKLIGMGAIEDRIIGEEKCMQRFELNAGRAIDEIDYPTEDQMESIVANQVRLVPSRRYWEHFGGQGERMIYG